MAEKDVKKPEKVEQSFEQRVRQALDKRLVLLVGQREQYRQAITRAEVEINKLKDDAIVLEGAIQELNLVLKDHFIPQVKDEMTAEDLKKTLGGTDGGEKQPVK